MERSGQQEEKVEEDKWMDHTRWERMGELGKPKKPKREMKREGRACCNNPGYPRSNV